MEPKKKRRRIQTKFWCGTDNTPKHWLRLPKGVAYIVWQHERVTHDHYQIFVVLERNQAMSYVKKNISETCHWEKKKGTPGEARNYCMVKIHKGKEKGWIAGPWELGIWNPVWGQRGYRTDIVIFRDLIKKGTSERNMIDLMPLQMCRWPQFYERCNRLYKPKQTYKRNVTVAIGASGTGKTRYGIEQYDDVFVIPIARSGTWFSGYDHHPHVLLDDFDGKMSKMGLKEVLRLLHVYVESVETKNGHAWWHPETIYITTNIRMERWYEWGDRTHSVLQRRIHKILDFGDKKFVVNKNPKDVTDEYDWDMDNHFVDFVGLNSYGNRKRDMYPFNRM